MGGGRIAEGGCAEGGGAIDKTATRDRSMSRVMMESGVASSSFMAAAALSCRECSLRRMLCGAGSFQTDNGGVAEIDTGCIRLTRAIHSVESNFGIPRTLVEGS